MTEFSSHAPGTFSWVELATTDQSAGVAFYRALFGWEVREAPISQGEIYSMFQMRGKDVAAAYTMMADERQMGVRPHWNLYISVASADDAARRAESLGATVLAPPFDVMEHGRMAVLQDPSGAVFCVWQPKAHVGARILNEPGALCWSELTTRDPQAAETFYTKLFGWTAKHGAASAQVDYTEFGLPGQPPGAGMMKMPDDMPAAVPSYWMPYFQVADCDTSTATAQQLGATLMVGPTDIPGTGRFAILIDPQGAIFAVFRFTGGQPQ
jgi:predicted enzyme related to lactoylglutathione lyase